MLEELSAERRRLRAELARADRAVEKASCSAGELRRLLVTLRDAHRSYTDLEDELMPQVLGALGAVRGDVDVASMRDEHARRRSSLDAALAAMDGLGTYESPGDVYAMTDALVVFMNAVSAALYAEERLLRSASDRTEAMNNDGFSG
jgi:hypothetical protein